MKIRVVKVYEKELTEHKEYKATEDGEEQYTTWADVSYADAEQDYFESDEAKKWFKEHGYEQPTFPITKDNLKDGIAADHCDLENGNFDMHDLGYEKVSETWELLDDSGMPIKDKRPEGFSDKGREIGGKMFSDV